MEDRRRKWSGDLFLALYLRYVAPYIVATSLTSEQCLHTFRDPDAMRSAGRRNPKSRRMTIVPGPVVLRVRNTVE
jgi:hypothetical protein